MPGTGLAASSAITKDLGTDRVIQDKDAGLGGGLDQAEEGRLGVTDEELDEKGFRKPKR